MTDDPERRLEIDRVLDAPRAAVWRCFTDAEALPRWFAPRPWTTRDVSLDVRPGGRMRLTMVSPEGEAMPNEGVCLAVEDGRRLVTSDAYVEGWLPTEQPFMTLEVLLDDAGPDRTRYLAIVRHWRKEDREAHEAMGFHEGWNLCADQLEATAREIAAEARS
ncbi:MAG: SRPBCC family protein [Pseudomonadota bacterium]